MRRWEALTGTHNVRDLGGYATIDGRVTVWSKVWRGDSLQHLDAHGVAELERAGVRTVVDLRGEHEAREYPVVLSARVRYVNVPLRYGDVFESLRGLYRRMVDDYAHDVRAILGYLAEPGALPAVVHCAVGKDRTGVVSALLLGLAGVPSATIAEDYALSAGYLSGRFADAMRERIAADGGDPDTVDRILRSPAEAMCELLAYLDERYGGVVGYLEAIGVTAVEIERLRSELVGA